MVTVKFFGLISIENNVSRLSVQAGAMRQVMKEISKLLPALDERMLDQAIMFVNNVEIKGGKRFSMVLQDGDELAFLNPSSGG